MFPYIKKIKVNDCYAYQDFVIEDTSDKPFKHIVLTGRNGSGKSTILNAIDVVIDFLHLPPIHVNHIGSIITKRIDQYKEIVKANINTNNNIDKFKYAIEYAEKVNLTFNNVKSTSSSIGRNLFGKENQIYIFTYFKARRALDLDAVTSVVKESQLEKEILDPLNKKDFSNQFKQYLVNRKIFEAFDKLKEKEDKLSQNKVFFNRLTDTFRKIFDDKNLELVFVEDDFDFLIKLSNGQRVSLDQLSHGFSAFLNILSSLLLNTEFIRKKQKDFSYNPSGIVLIDEPETHLHLEMQYEVMPLLTNLFPNIQFIVATHSPAVMSSMENAIVYDISSQKTVSGWVQGSSFSELMVSHFGLENDFAPKADQLLEAIDAAYASRDTDKLKQLFVDYEEILTPSLNLEIESRIIELESQNLVNDKRN